MKTQMVTVVVHGRTFNAIQRGDQKPVRIFPQPGYTFSNTGSHEKQEKSDD